MKEIIKDLEKVLFHVKHNATPNGIKRANRLLSDVNHGLEQYVQVTGNHDDLSKRARQLSSELSV